MYDRISVYGRMYTHFEGIMFKQVSVQKYTCKDNMYNRTIAMTTLYIMTNARHVMSYESFTELK